MKRICGVIFDCDGVMISSRNANRAFYNKVLDWFGLPPMTVEQENYCFMATALEALKFLLPADLHGQIDHVTTNEVNYARDIMPLIELMPGFAEFSAMLHRHGLRQAIATNRTDIGLQRVLDFFALPKYFDPVITASNAVPKPAPEGALRICQAWGAGPDEVVFVGDSEHDRQAAMAAGTIFAAFGEGAGLGGDLVAADYAALARDLAPLLPPLPAKTTRGGAAR